MLYGQDLTFSEQDLTLGGKNLTLRGQEYYLTYFNNFLLIKSEYILTKSNLTHIISFILTYQSTFRTYPSAKTNRRKVFGGSDLVLKK